MIDNLIDNLADIFLGQVNIIKLIGPTIRHGDLVDLIEVGLAEKVAYVMNSGILAV